WSRNRTGPAIPGLGLVRPVTGLLSVVTGLYLGVLMVETVLVAAHGSVARSGLVQVRSVIGLLLAVSTGPFVGPVLVTSAASVSTLGPGLVGPVAGFLVTVTAGLFSGPVVPVAGFGL
ncbi:unnamed protein product, partial [Linum tenue]